VSITATVTPPAGAEAMRLIGPHELHAVGKRGIGIARRGLLPLEQPIRLHQLDTRIALQASDQGFERLVGRHLIHQALHLDRSQREFSHRLQTILSGQVLGDGGPLRLEPLGQSHDDLPGLQLLGHAGFGDGGRRFVFRDGAAAGKEQTQGVGQNSFPVRGAHGGSSF
jgi:hypothetical protein